MRLGVWLGSRQRWTVSALLKEVEEVGESILPPYSSERSDLKKRKRKKPYLYSVAKKFEFQRQMMHTQIQT